MKRAAKLSTFVVICIISTGAMAGKKKINNSEFGDKWPFTVSEGILKCSKRMITFTTKDGVTYGVNGTAKNFGHPAIEPIWKVDTAMLEELAKAFNKTVDEVIGDDPPIRISIGPIIKVGLELCE